MYASPPQYFHAPASWPFDLESGVRVACDAWTTCMPILVLLGLSVLELFLMYATDRRQTKASLKAPAYKGRGHNNVSYNDPV